MKNIKRGTLAILFLLVVTVTKGQNKFEEFTVNDSIGIVEIGTLKEFLRPSIIFQKKIYINPNYLTFRENDSLKIFSKINGTWRKPLYIGQSYPVFELNDKTFLITIADDKNVVLNSDLNVAFKLNKKYEEIQSLTENFLFAIENDKIDIYKFDLKKIGLMHSVYATKYLKRKENYDLVATSDCIFFFGGEQTYQYDLNFKLIREINKKFENSYQLDEFLSSQSKTVMMVTNKGPDYPKKKINTSEFLLVDKKDKNKFSSTTSSFNILTDVNFDLRSENSKDFIVYKVFTTMKDGIALTSKGSAHSYRFKILNTKPKILLPLRFQKEIGMEIVRKK